MTPPNTRAASVSRGDDTRLIELMNMANITQTSVVPQGNSRLTELMNIANIPQTSALHQGNNASAQPRLSTTGELTNTSRNRSAVLDLLELSSSASSSNDSSSCQRASPGPSERIPPSRKKLPVSSSGASDPCGPAPSTSDSSSSSFHPESPGVVLQGLPDDQPGLLSAEGKS